MLHITLVVHYILYGYSRQYETSDIEDAPEDDRQSSVFAFEEGTDDDQEDSDPISTDEESPTVNTEALLPRSVSAGLQYSVHSGVGQRSESRESFDPEEIFDRIFADDGSFDFDFLSGKTRGRTLEEVVSWCDVDHYNLLEKAVIYNSRTLVRLLLSLDEKATNSWRFVFVGKAVAKETPTPPTRCFRGAVHLAAFLGCVDILAEFLKSNPSVTTVRGPVHIRPVHGPPNDLFRIIGYCDSTRNPRLAFQMHWLRHHPNELPVHYAICGGYPIIMKMLLVSTYTRESMVVEKDAMLANLVRQAASCASYNCLEVLYADNPGAMYARDPCGWLYIGAGFGHGIQFVKFLLEHGFAIKLLNNIDGKGTVSALHLVYSSLVKPDGALAKFTDLYDVSEMLLDLAVDVNMQTMAFRSHNVADTALHILLDNVNLVLSSVLGEDGAHYDSKFLAEVQDIYDNSIRDTICLILENGFELEKHCYSLLKRLFMNRNFVRKYCRSSEEEYLVRANYGLRHVYNIAKLLLDTAEIRLCPARREITPALYLIDSLRDRQAVYCVFGDRRATQVFNSCLRLLFERGDNANVYPFFANEHSYMASPLVHLCDVYVGHWCGRRIDSLLVRSAANFPDALSTICDSGARFACYMYTGANFCKHGVYDATRKLFVAIHRQLDDPDQANNCERLRLFYRISSVLVRYGADPIIEEYAFRKSRMPTSRNSCESTILAHILSLGLYCSTKQTGYGKLLVGGEEYCKALTFHLNLANHRTYYACLYHAVSMARDLGMDQSADDASILYLQFVSRAENVRRLKEIVRLRIYESLKPNPSTSDQKLPLPPEMSNYIFRFEQ